VGVHVRLSAGRERRSAAVASEAGASSNTPVVGDEGLARDADANGEPVEVGVVATCASWTNQRRELSSTCCATLRTRVGAQATAGSLEVWNRVSKNSFFKQLGVTYS